MVIFLVVEVFWRRYYVFFVYLFYFIKGIGKFVIVYYIWFEIIRFWFVWFVWCVGIVWEFYIGRFYEVWGWGFVKEVWRWLYLFGRFCYVFRGFRRGVVNVWR